MKKGEILQRWAREDFLLAASTSLHGVFVAKELDGPADLRGLAVGLDGQPACIGLSDFQDARLTDIDLSYGQFSCSFSRAVLRAVDLSRAKLDTCRMARVECVAASFSRAQIHAPTFDDARFEACDFGDAQIRGRWPAGYGGRRAVFERCSFRGSRLRALEFRACRFIHCTFDGVSLERCVLSGVRFLGTAPPPDQLCRCWLRAVTLDAREVQLNGREW